MYKVSRDCEYHRINNDGMIDIDENGAFTKIDEKFNCKYYADNIKYIGDNDETFEYIET